MSDIPDHLQELFRRLVNLPVSEAPSPWRAAAVHSVGGLTDVGFGISSDLLLVLSHDGRGLFDCASGERIARDRSTNFEHDTANLLARGIGPIAGQLVRTAGLYGGGLALTTADGWNLDSAVLTWPTPTLFLSPPGESLYGRTFTGSPGTTKLGGDETIRVFGFSPTGRAFIIGSSSDLTIYNRNT